LVAGLFRNGYRSENVVQIGPGTALFLLKNAPFHIPQAVQHLVPAALHTVELLQETPPLPEHVGQDTPVMAHAYTSLLVVLQDYYTTIHRYDSPPP
jgi:hypothetical protein